MKSLTPPQWREPLAKFTADEDDRPSLAIPFEQNGYICATGVDIIASASVTTSAI